jgi:poly(glycerol-phosphate) alpha-glucosyltransferase
MLDPWAVRRSGWKKRLAHSFYEGENLRKAACLHALTESEAQALRDYGLANPIAVIPNGTVPPSDAELEAVPPPAWMAGDDRSVLLFLGRIHPKKGLSETLPAWARLKMEDPKLAARWRLVVAGWGEAGYLERLRTQTARLRLERDVTFVGSLYGKDKFAAFAHASVFILASHSEGLPVAVLEAWAHRLPALISPACNLSEAVQAGAAIQAAGNTDEIALGLAKVMRMERQDLKAMGINGRRLVECQYAWPRIAAEMAGVYAWILGRGARPSCVQLD